MTATWEIMMGKDVYPCFAQSNEYRPPFTLPVYMTEEKAIKWLSMIAEAEAFNFEIKKASPVWKGRVEHQAVIYPKTMSRSYLILLGNLCKGVSEFKFFCDPHLDDDRDLPFFDKSHAAFSKFPKVALFDYDYNPNHGWWSHGCGPSEVKTIQELFFNFNKHKPTYNIWKTCLQN